MARIRPFYCIRPEAEKAARIAALPYDVYTRAEAKAETEREPLSFLRIDRAETQFPDDVGMYEPCVYEKARETLEEMEKEGLFIREQVPCFYLYELTMGEHVQTGIVACSSVDDYLENWIRKHENTREEKELDRIRHVDAVNAHTGPIFLAYRGNGELRKIAAQVKKEGGNGLLYDFESPDGVRHRVFRIGEAETVLRIEKLFGEIPYTYIADGHHRAASAVKAALKRRAEKPDYTGEEGFNWFLSVLFEERELQILPYNRIILDRNGLAPGELLERISENFRIQKADGAVQPDRKGTFGLYLDGDWYRLTAGKETESEDAVKGLDVSVLQDFILGPVLGIGDPRTDKRIEFSGGIRGLSELEERAGEGAAFSMCPTSMEELLRVADEGRLMPPKSTWFEPKLRSGLFIHSLE